MIGIGARTHTESTGVDLFPGGGDPSPIRPTSLVGAHSYISPVTRGFSDGGGRWTLDRVRTYKGQRKVDVKLAETSPPPPSPPLPQRGEFLAELLPRGGESTYPGWGRYNFNKKTYLGQGDGRVLENPPPPP